MYMYGIINANTKFFWDKDDISFNKKVYTIPHQDISAIVNDAEIVNYTHLNKEFLARMLISHQRVLEEVMNTGYTVVPVRLGTFAVNKKEVMNILATGYTKIKDICNKINNKIEIDVVAVWNDFSSILKEIGKEKEIMEFKKSVLNNSEGITYENRIRMGTMVKEALDKKREQYACQIRNVLSTVVGRDFKIHELMNDTMVLNIAFLVDKSMHESFDRKIEELNIDFAEKLNFRCIGPLPPFSFNTLEIKKMSFEEIDWARKKLGLNNNLTNKEKIKKAYYKSSLVFHPDKNPHTPGIENEFNSVKKAYDILSEYCTSVQSENGNGSFSLEETAFAKNPIVINVRD